MAVNKVSSVSPAFSSILYAALLLLQTFYASGQQLSLNNPLCDATAQNSISNCAQELSQLGIFSGDALSTGLNAFDQVRRQSRDYFEQICNAYARFNSCLGVGRGIKENCWSLEPIKRQYAVADAALNFLCGPGYFSMLANWDCYLSSARRRDVATCEARVASDARQLSASAVARPVNSLLAPSAALTSPVSPACFAMQNYVECIREPISMMCGDEAWSTVVQAIQRPLNVYLPYCTLGAGALTAPTLIILIVVATLVILL